MLSPDSKLFGSRPRTETLIAVALLKETYTQELARVLGLGPTSVSRILDSLEREGVVSSRLVGRNRMISLNPRMYGFAELEAFLLKYAQRTDIETSVEKLQRRRGKEL
jgi:DNA-binding transcriptional ArsR family regulator